MDIDDQISDYMEYLVEVGVLIPDGMDEYGEQSFRINIDLAEIYAPEFAKSHLRETEDAIIDLYEKGLVDMTISDDGEVLYSIKDQPVD